MESLQDIIKALPQQWMGRMEEQKRSLFENPVIQKFRQQYPELSDEELTPYLNKLYQYAKENEQCSACPSLSQCKNDFAGHYTTLEVEKINGQTVIHEHQVACRKLRVKQKNDAIRRRVKSFFVDANAIHDGYSLREIVSIDGKRAKAVEQLADYIEQTRVGGLQKKGLYLAGPFGTGKTYLMGYLLHELAKAGYSGVIVYMPDFVEELKLLMFEPGKVKENVDILKDTDILVFDDLGAENLNPWVRDHVMATILNYRMNRKPTFYTSNYDLDALEKHFSFTSKDGDESYKGERIMDRIRHFVDVIKVQGYNKRKPNK